MPIITISVFLVKSKPDWTLFLKSRFTILLTNFFPNCIKSLEIRINSSKGLTICNYPKRSAIILKILIK
jgi:hypothetical protein